MDTESGQIWESDDNQRSFFSTGKVINHACNVHRVCGLDKKYDKYYPVSYKILKYARKLKIKQLRLTQQHTKQVRYGWKVWQSYGYISRSRFESLLYKRKHVSTYQHKAHKVVLLKNSDAE